MAWSTPTTRAAGYVVPNTVWNSDVVENAIALRAGAIAIASQAAGDVIYATSSTQFGRLAIGSANTVMVSNGTVPSWTNTPTLTGTNFSSIPETAITDGSVLARLAGNETISGAWTFSSNTPTSFDRAITVQTDGVVTSGFYDSLKTRGWDAIGDDNSGIVIGGYRTSQWTGVALYGNGSIAASFTPTASTVAGTLGVTGAISSSASVALTGTTNNLGTITAGVWNAGAVTTTQLIVGATKFRASTGTLVSAGANEARVYGGAFGTGAVTGSGLVVGNNTSGNGAPGVLIMNDRASAQYSIFVQDTGDVRISSAGSPSETSGDAVGTVVGTQSSLRSTKNIYGTYTANADSLALILSTPLYDFDYKSGAMNGQRFIGITTDDSPAFGMDLGRSFNPVSAFGHTVAAIKELERRLAIVEVELARERRR